MLGHDRWLEEGGIVMSTTPKQPQVPGDIPPAAALIQILVGGLVSRATHVAAKLGIADLLQDSPRTCDELAKATGTHTRSLYRLLRALASAGVFKEAADGRFELTPIGDCLRTNAPVSFRALGLVWSEPLIWDSLSDLLYSVQTGQPAFDRLHGMGFFTYLEKRPEAAEIFNHAMTDLSREMHRAAIKDYDFSRLNTIVDVGGGHGALLSTILNAHPHLQGILFDVPHVVESARAVITTAGPGSRCVLVGGDFFQKVPAGGDAYLLAHILHDWDDTHALTILKNIHQATAKGGKVLILEQVIPKGNEPHLGKVADLLMLATLGGVERTEREFEELLNGAGFVLSKVTASPSPICIVEGVRS